jgi:hypothetical protein
VTGTIHLFEPQHDVFAALRFNAQHLPAALYNMAVAEGRGGKRGRTWRLPIAWDWRASNRQLHILPAYAVANADKPCEWAVQQVPM